MYAAAFQSAVNAWKLSGGMASRDFDGFAQILGERLSVNAGLAQATAERAAAAGNSAKAQYWTRVAETQAQLALPLNNSDLNVRKAALYDALNEAGSKMNTLRRFGGEAVGAAADAASLLEALATGDGPGFNHALASVATGMAATAAAYGIGFLATVAFGVTIPVIGLVAVGVGLGVAAEYLGLNEWLSDNVIDPAITGIRDAIPPETWSAFFSITRGIFGIVWDVSALFQEAKQWVQRRDPLVIDLDGDGIETVGVDGAVLFDHNGDGVKTGTGWVQADDGFLVFDRNGNGVIDTGAELFGVDTVKADGSRARDGFDALRDLDSNGDLVFDANDASFGSVRIWQDLDQDGVTDAGELRSLSDAGIVGINLVAPRDNVNLGNGNVQTASAANLFADDREGITANLDLADNPFVREFIDEVPLTEAAQALPEMRGSGMVRDLREAMSLSADLANAVSTFVGFDSYAAQRAQIDSLVSSWADTSTFHRSVEEAQALRFEVVFLVRSVGIVPSRIAGAASAVNDAVIRLAA